MARSALRKVRDAWAARRALARVLRQYPETRSARIGRCLLAKRERAVFAGRMDGRAVAFKLVMDPDLARPATESWRSGLARHWPRMSEGSFRVPEPLFFAPEHGLSVTSRAPGRRMTEALARSSHAEQIHMVSMATDWLERFVAEPRRRNIFSPGFWIGNRQDRLDAVPEPDRPIARQLIDALRRQEPVLFEAPITQVWPHGDYWSHNLMWDGAVMTGLDFGTAGWTPVARDMGRFVTHLALTQPAPEGPWRHGLPARWVDAVSARPLLRDEPPAILRFFIGIELSHRLISEAPFPRMRAETLAAVARYIAEPD